LALNYSSPPKVRLNQLRLAFFVDFSVFSAAGALVSLGVFFATTSLLLSGLAAFAAGLRRVLVVRVAGFLAFCSDFSLLAVLLAAAFRCAGFLAAGFAFSVLVLVSTELSLAALLAGRLRTFLVDTGLVAVCSTLEVTSSAFAGFLRRGFGAGFAGFAVSVSLGVSAVGRLRTLRFTCFAASGFTSCCFCGTVSLFTAGFSGLVSALVCWLALVRRVRRVLVGFFVVSSTASTLVSTVLSVTF